MKIEEKRLKEFQKFDRLSFTSAQFLWNKVVHMTLR